MGQVDPIIASTAEVVLIRHGQGECNAAGTIGGRLGCRGLSELGRSQSHRLAERMAQLHQDRPFEALFCTPRLRVVECAQIIGARLGRPVVVIEALRGQDFGIADGQPWLRVTEDFGGPPSHDPDRPIAAGAEPWNAYADRVIASLAQLFGQHGGRRILLVGHGKTTGLAGALLSGAPQPAAAATAYIVDHGALSHWQHDSTRWDLIVSNNSEHLREQYKSL